MTTRSARAELQTEEQSGQKQSDVLSFNELIDEAELCCEQARAAGRHRRYRAACGLFNTAISLYRHATTVEGVSYRAVETRINAVEIELSAYKELVSSDIGTLPN